MEVTEQKSHSMVYLFFASLSIEVGHFRPL